MTKKYHLMFRSRGRLISGTFTIRDGMVFARSEYGKKATQIGGSTAESIARHLLRELADEAIEAEKVGATKKDDE